MREAHLRIEPLAIVRDRTFGTEFPAIDWMCWIAPDLQNLVILLNDDDPTGVITITWTGGADMFRAGCHGLFLRYLQCGSGFRLTPSKLWRRNDDRGSLLLDHKY